MLYVFFICLFIFSMSSLYVFFYYLSLSTFYEANCKFSILGLLFELRLITSCTACIKQYITSPLKEEVFMEQSLKYSVD